MVENEVNSVFFEVLRKLSNFSVNRQQRPVLINLINFIILISLIIFHYLCGVTLSTNP